MSRSAPLPPPPIASPVAESAIAEVPTSEVPDFPPEPQPSRPRPGQAVDLVRDGVGYPAIVVEALVGGQLTVTYRPAPAAPRSLVEDLPAWDGKSAVGDYWTAAGSGPSSADAARRRIEAAREAGIDIPAIGLEVAHFKGTPHGAVFAQPATVVGVEDVTADGPVLTLAVDPGLRGVCHGLPPDQLREYGTRRGVKLWNGVIGVEMAGTYTRPGRCPVSPGAVAYSPGHHPCGVCGKMTDSLVDLTRAGRAVRACSGCLDAARSCQTCRQKSDRLEPLILIDGRQVQVCPGCFRAAGSN